MDLFHPAERAGEFFHLDLDLRRSIAMAKLGVERPDPVATRVVLRDQEGSQALPPGDGRLSAFDGVGRTQMNAERAAGVDVPLRAAGRKGRSGALLGDGDPAALIHPQDEIEAGGRGPARMGRTDPQVRGARPCHAGVDPRRGRAQEMDQRGHHPRKCARP